MRAWVNGSVLEDPTSPAIQVADHGFTVGDGVFEAVKVVDGRPVRADPAPRRLAFCRALLSGSRSRTATSLRAAVDAVLEGETAETLPLGRLRITYTGGVAPLGSGRGDSAADRSWWSRHR